MAAITAPHDQPAATVLPKVASGPVQAFTGRGSAGADRWAKCIDDELWLSGASSDRLAEATMPGEVGRSRQPIEGSTARASAAARGSGHEIEDIAVKRNAELAPLVEEIRTRPAITTVPLLD